jgi:hypothetical protein
MAVTTSQMRDTFGGLETAAPWRSPASGYNAAGREGGEEAITNNAASPRFN